MLWSIIGKRLASKPIYSPMGLIDRLQEAWNNIDQGFCIKLVDSMPEHIQKYLKAKAEHYVYFLSLLFFYMNKLVILKTALNFCSLEKNDGCY